MVRTANFPGSVGSAIVWPFFFSSSQDALCSAVGAPGGGAGFCLGGGDGLVRSLVPPTVKSTPGIGVLEDDEYWPYRVAPATPVEKTAINSETGV